MLQALEHKPHLLVVDDDDRLRALLQNYLSEHGFWVSVAANTREADILQTVLAVDALVLDIMMPQETGLSYAKRLQEKPSAPPILLLTARGEADDRITGLEHGAEDYLVKPFAPRELVLRIQTMLRRRPQESMTASSSSIVTFGDNQFDSAVGKLTMMGEPVYLTSGEIACLRILSEHAGQPVSREEMASQMGDVNNVRSVDVQINRLRKKIEANPAKPIYLQTVRHAGYVLYAKAEAR